MKRNLLRTIVPVLFLSATAVAAYADPNPVIQTSTITLVNGFDDITYSIFDYLTSGNAAFDSEPSQILPSSSVTFNVTLNPGSSAGFKFRAFNNPSCIIDIGKRLYGCSEIKLTNNSDIVNQPFSAFEYWDNLKRDNVCNISFATNNHMDIICRTNESVSLQ